MKTSAKWKRPGIYKITSPTSRIYIGQSINVYDRIIEYKKARCKSQLLLYKSFLKHGINNHSIEVLSFCDVDKLHEMEMYFISKFKSNKNTYKNGIGLNLTDGGQGSRGYKHSDETRRKMSLIRKKQIHSPESNKKRSISMTGIKRSKESIEKLKYKKTKDHIEKVADASRTKLIDTNTNKIYNSIKEASESLGYNKSTLSGWLIGRYKNKSTLKYYENIA